MLGRRVTIAILALSVLVSGTSGAAIERVSKDTLMLVHVLFRHGNRTADSQEELYPTDPHYNRTYFPTGMGQLTNAGKLREFNIGRELRATYNEFLGDVVYPTLVDARSTDVNRTKASLLYCLAGLFPPKDEQVWNGAFAWQAIPTYYLTVPNDQVLAGRVCPNYESAYEEFSNSLQQRAEYAEYQDVMDYISEHSGLNITTFKQIYAMYFGVSTEVENGLSQPKWLKKVWPDQISQLAVKYYHVATATKTLKQFQAGFLIKKIFEDSIAKILENTKSKFKKKLYLYSAHEINVASLLLTLGVFDDVVPNYGSYVSFELHKINGEYGFKIFYQNYLTDKPILLNIPGCGEFCVLTTFYNLFSQYMPPENICGF